MPVIHVVAPGEYLSLIALKHGFRDQRVIWDHPDNAALKKRRKNPNVLMAGDRIVIPDRVAGEKPATVGAFNQFQAVTDAASLNIDFENRSRQPMRNRDGPLTLAGQDAQGKFVKAKPIPTSTDGAGRLSQSFTGPFIERAAATEGDFQMLAQPTEALAGFRLFIGGLDPVDEPSGQRQRLNNLGYFAGYTENDQDQLEWATEEFQVDEKLPDRGLFVDRKKNLPTWNHLAKRHGDMLAGEEVG